MSQKITKEDLAHLAKLARIELEPSEEDGLVSDLQKILDHFEELGEINTENVSPVSGGTNLENIFRDDIAGENQNTGKGKAAFPKHKNGFLVVPPVFE